MIDLIQVISYIKEFDKKSLEKDIEVFLKYRHENITCGLILVLLKQDESFSCKEVESIIVEEAFKFRKERLCLNLIIVDVSMFNNCYIVL